MRAKPPPPQSLHATTPVLIAPTGSGETASVTLRWAAHRLLSPSQPLSVKTGIQAASVPLPRVVGAAECADPLPKHWRGTAFPCLPLIDDGLPRGAHSRREPRLTQAQAPAHGSDADVVVDRHCRPDEGLWA